MLCGGLSLGRSSAPAPSPLPPRPAEVPRTSPSPSPRKGGAGCGLEWGWGGSRWRTELPRYHHFINIHIFSQSKAEVDNNKHQQRSSMSVISMLVYLRIECYGEMKNNWILKMCNFALEKRTFYLYYFLQYFEDTVTPQLKLIWWLPYKLIELAALCWKPIIHWRNFIIFIFFMISLCYKKKVFWVLWWRKNFNRIIPYGN